MKSLCLDVELISDHPTNEAEEPEADELELADDIAIEEEEDLDAIIKGLEDLTALNTDDDELIGIPETTEGEE